MRADLQRRWRGTWWIGIAFALGLGLTAANAAQPEAPTTYHDCYRSLRACQKKRCNNAVDLDQVTCVRQCAREYDTCASGAQRGEVVPGSDAPKRAPRDMKRYKTPRGS